MFEFKLNFTLIFLSKCKWSSNSFSKLSLSTFSWLIISGTFNSSWSVGRLIPRSPLELLSGSTIIFGRVQDLA